MYNPVEVLEFAYGRVEIHYSEGHSPPDSYDDAEAFLGEIKSRDIRTFGRERWTKHVAYPYLPYGDWPWDYENVDFYDLPDNSVESEEELRQVWEREKETDYVAFPVKLITERYGNASLVEVQAGSGEEPDGFVFVKTPWGENATPLQQLASLKGQPFDPYALFQMVLREWNMYLHGEVCECFLYLDNEDDEDAEHPDLWSAYGNIYGFEGAIEIAKEMIADAIKAKTKER